MYTGHWTLDTEHCTLDTLAGGEGEEAGEEGEGGVCLLLRPTKHPQVGKAGHLEIEIFEEQIWHTRDTQFLDACG